VLRTVQDFRSNTILLPRGSLSLYPSSPSSLEAKEINCNKLAFDHYSIFSWIMRLMEILLAADRNISTLASLELVKTWR
jgi:hypothetical protein